MAVSAVILGAATIGSSVYSSRQMRKAAQQPAPPTPQPNANEDFSAPDAAQKQPQAGRRRGNRSGTILTSGAGVTNGQTYQGNTLLGG